MVKWIITKYQHSWEGNRLMILVWTDEPIHAFLHYSLSPEIYSYITSIRRGVRRLIKPLWELPDQNIIEQAMNGDTLAHAFYIPAIPNLATLTFFISATRSGVEAKSVSIPIRVVHPIQGGADELDCGELEGALMFIPWESNQKDAVGIHDDIWNVTGMTGTAYFAYGMNQLSLIIGPTPGSEAQIYAGNIFDLAFDHTLDSQLRAIVRFPIVSETQNAIIYHGTHFTPSGYGFYLDGSDLFGSFRSSSGYGWLLLLSPLLSDTTYLLEAKYKAGGSVEWWINGNFIGKLTTSLPDSSGYSFFAYITHPTTASVAIHFRRFMIWQQSIWTSSWHEP